MFAPTRGPQRVAQPRKSIGNSEKRIYSSVFLTPKIVHDPDDQLLYLALFASKTRLLHTKQASRKYYEKYKIQKSRKIETAPNQSGVSVVVQTPVCAPRATNIFIQPTSYITFSPKSISTRNSAAMQGSYKNNGLPRPYYMKPHKRGMYESMARLSHLTNSRKLMGYVLMLFLFGLCMYMVGQELRGAQNSGYDIVGQNVPKAAAPKENMDGDVKNFVQSGKKKDSATEKELALGNKESLDEFDNVVNEAPMGGLVNEAPVVGNDAGLVIDGKKSSADALLEKKGKPKGVKIENKKKKGPSFSASRDEDTEEETLKVNANANAIKKPAKKDDEDAKIIKKNMALDSLREESKKKGADPELAQKIIEESEE